MTRTIATIVGARPQFIKAAPVSAAIANQTSLREVVIHTGQHFDPLMSDVFFSQLFMAKPAYNLEISGLGHGAMTGRMIEGIETILLKERPDAVLVYGDTNSTLAGALAAAKLHIPIAHVEAGLRSFNRRMPEEINRVLTDHASDLLFCPTALAVAHLAREGITANVHMVGDVMYDATLQATARAEKESNILEALGLARGEYALATLHRAENTDDPDRLRRLLDWLSEQARDRPVVMPVHPRTHKVMDRLGYRPEGIRYIEPVCYVDMAQLAHNAGAIFTDSGGLQKEAYFHRVPCVTLREETEWTETIEAGWNRLWTVDGYRSKRDIADYGDGDASRKVADLLRQRFS